MNRTISITILAFFGIATFLLASSLYTVSEVEQAIITQFGKPVGTPVTTAGLKIKVPVGEGGELCIRMSAPAPAATRVALQSGTIYTLLLKKGQDR